MNNNQITLDQFAAIQKIFDYFNEALFDGSLNQCLLNLSRMPRARGFFAPNRWAKLSPKEEGDTEAPQEREKIHEISLCPEHIARAPKEVISTLVHEMVHLWQEDFGKPSPGYHNKQWAAKMKEIGLYPSNTGMPGGKETGKNCSHYILEDGAYSAAYDEMPKEYIYPFVAIPVLKVIKPNKNKTKYTCPSCETNIWGKEGIEVMCNTCNEEFQQMD